MAAAIPGADGPAAHHRPSGRSRRVGLLAMQTVAIFGVGLIGGSFALALREAGFSGRIIGVSSPETIRKAVELGVIDAGLSAEQAAGSADLIYLAQPILRIVEILPQLDPWVRPDALVTDAGSTKSTIV